MIRGTPGLHPVPADVQAAGPVCLCQRCGGELYGGETSYFWDGRQMCMDCFRWSVTAWVNEAAQEAAQALGVETRIV